MLKARFFAAVALLWLCTSAWAGGSTVNPAVPVFGAAMSSAPIRNNFAAAYSDINNLMGQSNSVTAPTSPVLGQLWLNTSATPYALNEWDGSAWVAQGNLNASMHLWSFPLTGVVPWATLSGTPTTLAGYGITNGVSSVGLTMPSGFSCTGSPITSSGTISCAFSSQSASMFLASPVGASGAPTFRAIQPSDIPTLNQSTRGNAATATTATLATSALSANTANTATSATTAATATTAGNVTGVVAIANGGTASTTAAAAFNTLSPMTTTGDVEYESAAGTASRLPIGSNGQVFTVVSGAPAWVSSSSALVGTLKRSTHTTAYTTTAGDQQSVLYNTGTWTLTLTAPATLGNGWWEIVQNAGTGNITLSPASGTVDGLSSYVMYPGESRIVNTDGTNFYSVVLNPFSLKLLSTTTITIPPGYQAFTGILWGGGGGGASASSNSVYGGGGGAAVPFNFVSLGTVGGTIICTVAGTAAAGTNGNNSTLGSLLTAYGGYQGSTGAGGGGGGALSGGSGSTGGSPGLSTQAVDGQGLGGAGAGANSAWGGAGGGIQGGATGKSVYGGGGGGGSDGTTAPIGGKSVFGGAGGAGSNSGTAGAGVQPGGGGGSSYNGTGGSGAAGECYINGVI